MRAVLGAWQADNGTHLVKACLERGKQYVDGMERFDPEVTPAAVDEKWAKLYTAFLVRDTPLSPTPQHGYRPASSAPRGKGQRLSAQWMSEGKA